MRCVERQQICRRSEGTRGARHDSERALLELMSERNFAANTTLPSALAASSHTQLESQSPDSPSDLESSSQPEPITARDSSSSREPTPVLKPQKKPVYSCPTCTKHFSRSSTLSRYAKSHRGVKDYKCAICPRAFSRKDLLNRHVALHASSSRWACGARPGKFFECFGFTPQNRSAWGCGREFAREDDLKRHFGSQKGQLCMKSVLPRGFKGKNFVAPIARFCRVDNG